MVPVNMLFRRYSRAIRDMAREIGKGQNNYIGVRELEYAG